MREALLLLPLVFLLVLPCVCYCNGESEGVAQVGHGGGSNRTISQGVASVKGPEAQYIYDLILPMTLALLFAMIFGLVFALVLYKRKEEPIEYDYEY